MPHASPLFVAGDWGTSHLRLYLCRGRETLEQRDGPGIGALQTSPETVLFEGIAPWIAAHGALPVWLAGMVGSRNGWREAPYAACSADASRLIDAILRFDSNGHDIRIVPGMSCINSFGAPDVMRGEETQIIGAMALDPTLAGAGSRVLVLPGTHTKWVRVRDGYIDAFHTSLSGELYALLRDHSTLARAGRQRASGNALSDNPEAFEFGLERARTLVEATLSHVLFETRSRQLLTDMTPDEALAFLSGLIIGQDVRGALSLFDGALGAGHVVPVIGAPQLTELYRVALAAHGIQSHAVDATDATVQGLCALGDVARRSEVSHGVAS